MTDKKICNIEPKMAEVYPNGVIYIKPCGVRYSERHEVHCEKFANRTCEYMALEHIKRQQKDATEIDEILNDFYGGCLEHRRCKE
jgi:hypothetical protein